MTDATLRATISLPPEDAIKYLRAKDYRPTMAWAEMLHEEHNRAFTVAKIAQPALLETVRRAVGTRSPRARRSSSSRRGCDRSSKRRAGGARSPIPR